MSMKLCTGPRLAITNILQYAKKVSERFSQSKWFGIFWTSTISHNFLTLPHIGDKAYSSFISNIDLNRTALLVLSDHGVRSGPMAETHQGWLESCLPAAFMYLPKWFQKKFPEAMQNLKVNGASRLTTPFDVHATLFNLMEADANSFIPTITKRGISLFSPIPETRTCDSANIPGAFCTCEVK
jgi:hypothetical protein